MEPALRCDVRLCVVVDAVPCPPAAQAALVSMRERSLCAAVPGASSPMRLRFNARNLGASGTRNALLDVSETVTLE